ncbi:hypothetical protein B0H15DRAFT_816760 [Mycena belliarum]|uniref:FAR1 domain-containing protein n=1 Tax=Mycena belliarum TaxID=1033014 RepID=A0AAD6UIT2_9AGAR|nr:hypothetical protein B0H15DRAFT_816760 [Mycena belliae]
MTSFQGRFRLDCPRSSAPSPSDSSIVPSTAPNSPAFAYIEFRAHPDPTPPKPTRGCFEHDSASSKFGLRWERWTDFQAWLITEQETHCIELRLVNTYPSTPAFQRACRYVCSRKGTGGIKPYTKLHPEWNRKRGTKRTGCKCTLLVKEYPGVDTILGSYADQHNHPLGNANLPFTRIPKRSREYIAGENDTVLPSSQHIMPNAEESRCHETIPRVKTRTRGAGDPSYGGNANSGSEAKQPKLLFFFVCFRSLINLISGRQSQILVRRLRHHHQQTSFLSPLSYPHNCSLSLSLTQHPSHILFPHIIFRPLWYR